MVGTVVAAGAWDTVREASIVDGRVDAEGASVAVFTDILQPDLDVDCRARGPEDDDEQIVVPPASLDLQVQQDGTTWYLIGFVTEGQDQLRAACAPADRDVADPATYGIAVAEGWQSRANTGNGISVLATAAGAALALWTWLTRRRRRKQETTRA